MTNTNTHRSGAEPALSHVEVAQGLRRGIRGLGFSLRALCASASLRWILIFSFLAFPAVAKEAAPLADDPLTEKRLLAITAELRCLVCQNQTIADSNADLANDFRREIRKLIAEGKSDQEIMDFMVARYGDFVRYRPPVKGTTILLWAGPGVLLAIGLTVLVRYLRRRNDAIADSDLTAEEQQQAEALLQDATDKKPQ